MKKIKIIFILFISMIFINAQKKDLRLIYAARNNKIELLKDLLNNKDININTRSIIYNETALIIASEKGYTEIVKLLLENDADPNLIFYTNVIINAFFDFRFDTALLRAVDNNHKEIIKLLIDYGADVNHHQICYGWDAKPLILAKKNNIKEIIKMLEDAGANEILNPE